MNSSVNQFLSSLPVDKIAARVGADQDTVSSTLQALVPALLAKMSDNSQDDSGEQALSSALDQHDPSLIDGTVNIDDVDEEDGEKITNHVFGSERNEVAQQLGGITAGGAGLVQKLLPIVAPLLMSWLAGKVQGGGTSGKGGGVVRSVLGGLLGSLAAGKATDSGIGGALGGILGSVLGSKK